MTRKTASSSRKLPAHLERRVKELEYRICGDNSLIGREVRRALRQIALEAMGRSY